MKTFTSILLIGALSFALIALVPVFTLGIALLIIFGSFFIWALPILIIASSDETSGGEKLCWILAIIFLSWFAWILYFFVAPIKTKPALPRYRHYQY